MQPAEVYAFITDDDTKLTRMDNWKIPIITITHPDKKQSKIASSGIPLEKENKSTILVKQFNFSNVYGYLV